MPYDFPSSPTNGQTYTAGNKNYTYNGSAWELTSQVLNSDNISEGTSNLYLNEARFRDLANTIGLANVNNTTFTGNIVMTNNTNFLSEALFSSNVLFTSNAVISGTLLTVGNSISEGTSTFDSNANFYSNTTFNSNVINTGNLSVFGQLNLFSNTLVPGLINFTQTSDKIGTFINNPAINFVNADFRRGSLILDNPSSNVTVQISNVPTVDNNIYNFAVIKLDGNNATLESTVNVNGTVYDVRWLKDSSPHLTVSTFVVYTYAILRTKGIFFVIGQQSDYLI